MDITKDCEKICENIYKELTRNAVSYDVVTLVLETIRNQYHYYERKLNRVKTSDIVSVCKARDASHCERCIYQGDLCNSFCIAKGVIYPRDYKKEQV